MNIPANATSSSPATPAQKGDAPDHIQSPLSRADIAERLEQSARKGKMAGFSRSGGVAGSGELFRVSDFGAPFESVLIASGAVDPESPGTRVGFRVQLKPTIPVVYALALAFSIWPGVWLTDSLLRTYFTGYDYQTWMWYLPLTVPFCPWGFWKAYRKSKESGRVEAHAIATKIAELIRARTVDSSARTAARDASKSTPNPVQ